ncbi:basement membrane proteoglycan-like [Phlebotomus argentipes]|uniref:basement membrane proteoglycan-like n=1 Tax=Phlebotomus argentipes TaxID=94469 RepID=UPI0028932F88|nr:basement membrane proteoglycan-like [Phlebotomus argentipes]
MAGNGFVELDYFAGSGNSSVQEETALAIIFSTTAANGLLLWHGQRRQDALRSGDFIALAAVGGRLEFVFRLDGEEARIRNSAVRIDDGQPHVAILKRAANQGSLELDNYIDYDETKSGSARTMLLPGFLYIGGVPAVANFTAGRYRESFTGCVHVLQDITRGPINFGVYANSAENVHSCSNYPWRSSSLVYSDVENLLNGVIGGTHSEIFNHNFDEINEPPPVHIIYPRPAINPAAGVSPAALLLSVSALLALGESVAT